ncbi:protein spindle-F [Condylostylus longicornis]|uniref:protein spindle-F n=1 Tax=Condylostylus longicornis TaxID=2530218 RepID=UPI00244DA489|nr:protein spindle-F [Condylostylus longicornis]
MALTDTEELLKSNLAMRVAVQTMKERCQSLQHRVTGLEEENFELRNRIRDQKLDFSSSFSDNVEEIECLRKQILDLHQQKIQMNEHVAMVAAENRQLWSRLSQLSKKNCVQHISDESEKGVNSGQNLIRSKTFTQHAPNPYLRPKRIENSEFSKSDSISLEEVVLYSQEAENIEIESLKGETLQFQNLSNLNKDIDAKELTTAAAKCIEELNVLKQQLLAQQNELTNTIFDLKQKIANRICKECEIRSIKPETADKSLETDESLYTDISPSQSHQSQEENGDFHQEILNDKNIVEESVRICPMCGKIFSQDISFEDFREHVTEHFVDDEEESNVYDRHFEIISQKVGEF